MNVPKNAKAGGVGYPPGPVLTAKNCLPNLSACGVGSPWMVRATVHGGMLTDEESFKTWAKLMAHCDDDSYQQKKPDTLHKTPSPRPGWGRMVPATVSWTQTGKGEIPDPHQFPMASSNYHEWIPGENADNKSPVARPESQCEAFR